MVAPQVIRDWIDSINHFAPTLKRPQSHELESHQSNENVVDTTAYAGGSDTQTMTSANVPVPQKRGSNDLDRGDPDMTPKPPSLPPSRPQRSGSESPTRRTRTRLESREALRRLEKPVLIYGLEGNVASIPEDIKPLYKNIKAAAQYRQCIVPHEVRAHVEAIDDDIPGYVFRDPDQEQVNALAMHSTLQSIVRAAGISEKYRRLEAGWNHHVHTPLLDLVFGPDPSDVLESPNHQKPIVAWFEAVMGATIIGTAIPLIRQSGLDLPDFNLACSVSVDSSAENSEDSTIDLTRADLNTIHSRSESKKVDYVLVMYISEKEPLRQAIWDSTFESQLGYGYVNQTLQLNLLYNPIAVSIGTRITSSREDSLIQLGLWTAAWHKRMTTLHERLFPPAPQSYLATPRAPPRLVSVPLIEVISHEWFVYFACDSGISISIYGPLQIGSTRSILEAYALITSLEHVKQWIETFFYEGMKAWFL